MFEADRRRALRWAGALCGLLMIVALPVAAAEVKFFRLESRSDFTEGTFEGVGIDPLGTLQLADEVRRVSGVEEPFLFSAAVHRDGWVLGTGNDGKVILVDAQGVSRELLAAAEPEIFALWVDPDGTVFAGSSPDGKVYRIARDGTAAAFFDPGETYIWALARAADGELLVATGTEGRIYKVDQRGEGRIFYDGDDIHVRSMKALPGGDLLVGTAGKGLILRVSADGAARTLHDAVAPEVVAFAAADDGVCYAAVLASEASSVDLNKKDEKGENGDDEKKDDDTVVTVSAGDSGDFSASRPTGYRGARSEIFEISASGVVESVWSFKEQTIYSMLWHRGRLWVGTGQDGKLYSLQAGQMVLEKDVDERQVVALLPSRPGPVFATTNAAALYGVSDRSEREGQYTGPALDAGNVARFGTLLWRGEAGDGAGISFSVRSGMSAEPDSTWSPWSEPLEGAEVPLAVPKARYLQWRAHLSAGDRGSPRLTEVSVSYRQENLAPRITRLSVLAPGEILLPSNYNPGSQVFEPSHPNRQGIFTTLEMTSGREERRFKTLWKRGFRTLRWETTDANGDGLEASILFRPDRAGAPWLPLAEDLDVPHHSFDVSGLPDGLYRFQLVVSDGQDNAPDDARTANEVSEAVVVDHTPPVVVSTRREKGRLLMEVRDELNPLREAQVSVDAGEWRPAATVDGLLDGHSETVSVPLPAAGSLALLRIGDAAFNYVTIDLQGVKP